MKIYHYHRETNEYLGESDAKRDPLEKKTVYRIPANATKNPPPSTAVGEVAVYNGTRWQKVPDYRGETWYDKSTGTPVLIETLGTPDPALLTNTQPTRPPPKYWQQRQAEYHKRIAALKNAPEATKVDVLGFIIDAQSKAILGDNTELLTIDAIVQAVNTEFPKP